MLEGLAKGPALTDETAIRAALHLVRDYGRDDLRPQLRSAARNARRDVLRGVAAAALFDVGDADAASNAAEKLIGSKQLSTATWAALVRAALAGKLQGGSLPRDPRRSSPAQARPTLVTEPNHRRIQLGWVE
jgi:hypothetical protein